MTNPSGILAAIVQQHVEEAAILRNTRSGQVAAPHVKLRHLRRLDDRLAAHLDGVAVAGEAGWKLCSAALADPGVGAVFVATVQAIEGRQAERIDRMLALAEAVPALMPGVVSAFGWVSAPHLEGTIQAMLSSPAAMAVELGLAACAMHGVDAGAALAQALSAPDARLRVRALRVAGDAGERGLLSACKAALADPLEDCRFQAARSAVLLGDRGAAVRALTDFALAAGPRQASALAIVLKALAPAPAGALLTGLAQTPASGRALARGAGVSGDPRYIPWLIEQMEGAALARVAGEAFSMVTGLDLALPGLDRRPAEGHPSGPNDDPDDEDVAMDEDDGLPWPDPAKIDAWWNGNRHGYQSGVRYFMGQPLTVEHCRRVLRDGYQRQRIAAAEHLRLLQPGIKLFPTGAPAWRQERWLKKIG